MLPAADIAAFDRASQARVQAILIAACEAWRVGPAAAVLADLERFGTGEPLPECPALEAVVSGPPAEAWVAEFSGLIAAQLEAEPLGQPPLRHGFDGATASLLLARSGRAQFSLLARQPGTVEFASATFSDEERYDVILAGCAQARWVRQDIECLSSEPLVLAAGTRLAIAGPDEALQATSVSRTLVTLRLQRTAERPRPTRSLAMADGALLHQAAGDIRASRHELMLAVLGRMQRREALPVMAAMAREPGDASLRWQALRECLALDTETGFQVLGEVARATADALAAPAGALQAQLLEAHPELRRLEEPCLG